MISSRWELTSGRAFGVFFFGALSLGAAFQWLVLPYSPWHAGHGLFAGGDWVQFFDQARELAAKVRINGWQAWELRYQGQWPASLMAAAFVLTGWEHASVVLPIYAAIYGLSAAMLTQVCNILGLHGRAIWLASAILAFPSTILIWGQPHKDIFALAGIFLLVWSWTEAWRGSLPRRWLWVFVGVVGALGFMRLPRPYLLDVTTCALGGAILLAVVFSNGRKRDAGRGALFFLLVAVAAWGYKTIDRVEQVEQALCDSWRPESYVQGVHEKVGTLLCYRHGFILGHGDAEGSIDHDRLLVDYRELIDYLPRAAFLAVAVPIPRGCSLLMQCKVTSPGGAVKRLVAAFEMMAFYVAMLGWLGWVTQKGHGDLRSLVLGLIIFAWAVALFYVLTSPNEGTIYRLRYPEMALWWCGGVAGWSLLLRKMREMKNGVSNG